MQSSTTFNQSVAPGAAVPPGLYNTQPHLTNQFTQQVPSNTAQLTYTITQPFGGMLTGNMVNNNLNQANQMTQSNSPVNFSPMFTNTNNLVAPAAGQGLFYSPTSPVVSPFQFMFAGNEAQNTGMNSIQQPAIPQPTGYKVHVNDGNQQPNSASSSPQLMSATSPVWKADPAQTPNQTQQFYFPTFTPNQFYFQTPNGFVPTGMFNYAPMSSSDGNERTKQQDDSPRGSVESGTSMSTTSLVDTSFVGSMPSPMITPMGSSIQNCGITQMEFMANSLQPPSPMFNPALLTANPTNMMSQNMFIPNSNFDASVAETNVPQNMAESGETTNQGHRGRSRSSNSHNTGFAEAHQMQNMSNERHSSQENFTSQRTGHDSSRQDHFDQYDQYDRRDRRGKRYSPRGPGRYRSQRSVRSNVPMVNSSRTRNQRPRKPYDSRKPRQRNNKRYGYRTKQNKIEKVYDAVTRHFEELGVLIPEDVGIRGTTVARLHVKKWNSLCRIEEAILLAEKNTEIQTLRVSCPVSMKNLFQKKGFLIYWETGSEKQVQMLMDSFKSFDAKDQDEKFILDEFQKISVALQTERKEPHEETEEKKLSSTAFETVPKAVQASLERVTNPTTYYPEVKKPLTVVVDRPPKPTFSSVGVQTDLAFFPTDDDLAFSDDESEFAKPKLNEEAFGENDKFNCMPLCRVNSSNSLIGA